MTSAARLLLISGVILFGLLGIAPATHGQQSDPSPAAPPPAAAPLTPPAAPTSSSSDNPLGDALALFRKGDFEGSIRKYEQIIAEKPKSPDAYAWLTRVYLKKKDVDRAYATVQKALQDADSAPVRVALGEVYFRQGKIPEAEHEWVTVINSGHQNARAYLGLARVRWALSLYKAADVMINKARQLDANDPDITKRWQSRLTRVERIKYLEQYLAGENNDDSEIRAYMRHYLEYLKARVGDSRKCHLITKGNSTETTLVRLLSDPQHLRGFGLLVDINGDKSKLLLDTGASGIMLKHGLAEKAGVTKLSEIEISGIGDKGNKTGYIGLVSSLKVGDLEFKDCTVRVSDERSVIGEDGLIGADVFSSFLIDLDFANEKMRLSPLPQRPGDSVTGVDLQTDEDDGDSAEDTQPKNKAAADASSQSAAENRGPQDRYIAPEMKSYTQVYRFGHDLLVPTFIAKSSTPKFFLLDSGGFGNLITPAAAREVTKVHRDSDTTVKGLNGTVKNVFSADKAVLQFGHLRQENQDLVAFDLSHISDNLGTEVSGILGFALLRLLDVKIDYRDGLVDFKYDAEHWKLYAPQP